MSCNLKIGNHAEYGLIGLPNYYLKNFDHDEIKTKEVGKLLRAEAMLNQFFTSTYRDIEGIYYDKESTENDTIKLGNYEIKQTGGEWGDGSLLKEKCPDSVYYKIKEVPLQN